MRVLCLLVAIIMLCQPKAMAREVSIRSLRPEGFMPTPSTKEFNRWTQAEEELGSALDVVSMYRRQYGPNTGTVFRSCYLKDLRKGQIDLLPDVPGLVEVQLSGHSVDDDCVSILQQIPKLRKVWIATDQISAKGVRRLSSLTKLDELGVDSESISDITLKNIALMKSVQRLSLISNQMSAKGLADIMKMKSLCWLRVASSQISLQEAKLLFASTGNFTNFESEFRVRGVPCFVFWNEPSAKTVQRPLQQENEDISQPKPKQ